MVGIHMDGSSHGRRDRNQWVLGVVSEDSQGWDTKFDNINRKLKKIS